MPHMTIEALHASLPPELRVDAADVPADVRAAVEYLVARDSLVDNDGVPVDQLPSYEDWKAARNG